MIKQGHDHEDILHTLSKSFYISGVFKVLPWFQTIGGKLPWAAQADSFRQFSKRLFLQRLKVGRRAAEPDVFYHLVGHLAHRKVVHCWLASDPWITF